MNALKFGEEQFCLVHFQFPMNKWGIKSCAIWFSTPYYFMFPNAIFCYMGLPVKAVLLAIRYVCYPSCCCDFMIYRLPMWRRSQWAFVRHIMKLNIQASGTKAFVYPFNKTDFLMFWTKKCILFSLPSLVHRRSLCCKGV